LKGSLAVERMARAMNSNNPALPRLAKVFSINLMRTSEHGLSRHR
jgi:hypothetical protein